MALNSHQKADILTITAILMGMVGMFLISHVVVESYMAPQLNIPSKPFLAWQEWAYVFWVLAMIYIGMVLPERILRKAYENERIPPHHPRRGHASDAHGERAPHWSDNRRKFDAERPSATK